MLYRVALGTGFRASELASLTPGSFDLNGERPTITVEAAFSKRRERDVQPIAQALARSLAPWLEDKELGVPVFGMPSSSNTAKMLKTDLEAAGLSYLTSEGVADFHALRHTYITRLAMSNERPKVVQELARHSKLELTMNVYTHLGVHDLQSAVDRMPDHGPKGGQPKKHPVARSASCTEGAEVCMRAGRGPVQNGARPCRDGGSAVGAESSGSTGRQCENAGREGDWSDGESNPDLLNAIQPSGTGKTERNAADRVGFVCARRAQVDRRCTNSPARGGRGGYTGPADPPRGQDAAEALPGPPLGGSSAADSELARLAGV